MNPIENLWKQWKRLLYSQFHPPRILDELARNIRESWKVLHLHQGDVRGLEDIDILKVARAANMNNLPSW